MEKLLELYKKETLTTDDLILIEGAIDNGNIDTCDIFDDFIGYVSKNCSVDYNILMNYQENYQNLLTHKENLTILIS